MAAYQVLLLNTAVPQIQAAQAGDTYVCPRDIQITANLDVTGNTILGDASTDTVRVNGYMGVGGAGTSNAAVYLASIALTGTSQYGFYSTPRATSAATAQAVGFAALVRTEDAAFTLTNAYGVSVENASKGASSTITNQHGVRIADQTQGTNNYGVTSLVSSGTNKWNIYASGTAANYFAGNVGIGTSSPAAPLDVNNSVSITNGVSVPDGNKVVFAGAGVTGGVELFRFGRGAYTTSGSTNVTFLFQPSVGDNGYNAGWYCDTYRPTTSIGSGNYFAIGQVIRAVGGTGNPATLIERLRLDSSGNLGLGVTPSAWASSFKAMQLGAGGYVSGRTNTDEVYVGANSYFDTTNNRWEYIVTDVATQYYQDAGAHVWRTAPSGTAGNAITFTERASISATEMVVNNPGEDYDFRVESDTNTHALFVEGSSGNVGIGTSSPNASAILDAQSTTKGVRMPNMTTTQKNAIVSPAAGLIVFDTTLAKLCVYSGSAWETITSV